MLPPLCVNATTVGNHKNSPIQIAGPYEGSIGATAFYFLLPFLEKADGLKRSIETVKTLLNIYENLELEDKASEFRALYKSMK